MAGEEPFPFRIFAIVIIPSVTDAVKRILRNNHSGLAQLPLKTKSERAKRQAPPADSAGITTEVFGRIEKSIRFFNLVTERRKL